MSLLTWLGKVFTNVKKQWAKTAVAIGTIILPTLQTGGILAAIEESLSPKMGAAAVAIEQKAIVALIATGLAVEGLPDNPTQADIQTFEDSVVAAFGKLTETDKVKTTFVAQVYGIMHSLLSTDPKPTFGQCAIAVETAWEDLQADKAAEAADDAQAAE